MNLENFLRNTILPQMQVTSLYFKPEIPQDKLANAIREYAPSVGMSTVVVLVDETFWGNAKEGMIVTNEQIILSKKLGGRTIQLTSVNQIEIKDKNLIINDLPVAKFSNPEVMPLVAFGTKLNEFVLATKKTAVDHLQSPSTLDDSTTGKLTTFLARITEPLFFESAPAAQRKPGATTPGFVLASSINDELRQFLRFKAGFAPNEKILCASWLDNHDCKDYFFCVTNFGVYSLTNSRPVSFISHVDLRNLNVVEEYKESRYIGLRFSNGQEIIVSIQNAFVRPYAQELFAGVINILNGREPEIRHNEMGCNQQAANAAHQLPTSSVRLQHENVTAKPTNELVPEKSIQDGETPIAFRYDGSDRLFDSIIQCNAIDNVGDLIGSIFSNSDNANSKVRKSFQSYVARSLTAFRKEIIDTGGFSQFRNDVATMEICGAVMAFAFMEMLARGVSANLAQRILFEGIRATFNIQGGAKNDPAGAAITKIIESYIPDEDEDEDRDHLFFNLIMRLIGSNLNGRLAPDYFEVLKEKASLLEDFLPTIEHGLSRFLKKVKGDSCFLVDGILDTKW